MQKRLKFREGEQRRFLLEAEKISGLNNDGMARLFGIVPRSYRDWRRGKLNISLNAAQIIKIYFGIDLPEDKELMEKRATENKSEKARIGGIARYKIYGDFATAEGRRKGGSKTMAILRAKGLVPQPNVFSFPENKSEDLAEYCCILLGDGGIMESGLQITLNSEADRDYLVYVTNLIKKLFDFDAPYFKRKNCKANVIYCSGVKMVELLKELGLKVGNKVKQQVNVPDWITCNMEFSKACVRGLMDTDGGVFVHKYKVNGKEYRYLKISFSNRSVPILLFMEQTLRKLGFTAIAVLERENKQVRLYNQGEVLRYLKVVGTNNPRLLKHLEESDSWSIREVR